MPNFRISRGIITGLDDAPAINLDTEWSIIQTCTRVWSFVKFEIRRKNVIRECSVSGVFQILGNHSVIVWEKRFSFTMKCGESSEFIYSDRQVYFGCGYELFGTLNITENCEKYGNDCDKKKAAKPIQQKSQDKLLKDLELLLDPNRASFADVTLKCGGASIPAHKNILSARSPVFAAMFAQPMKESRENEVDITDIDLPILRDMLKYMYAGKTSDLTASSVTDLLFAADKYQLQDLKEVCSDFLKDIVSLQNVLRIFVLGDMHNEDLKLFALDYICNKSAEFSVLEKTEEWKTLQKDRPNLAMTILTAMVKAANEKSRK